MTARPIFAGLLCASALALTACTRHSNSEPSMLFAGKAVSSTGQPAAGADVDITFEGERGDLRRYRTRTGENGCFAQEIRSGSTQSLVDGSIVTQVRHPQYGQANDETRVSDLKSNSFVLIVLPKSDGPMLSSESCPEIVLPSGTTRQPAAP